MLYLPNQLRKKKRKEGRRMKITFNGVEMPEGVKVKSYYTSVLPPIEVQKVKIHGRAGMFNLAKTIGEKADKC